MASSSVAADMELDRPNLEDYLPPDSLPQEAPRNLHLRDLLDISPVLTEAAGAIVDRKLVEMMCSVFVASWTGVIKYHGPRPSTRPRQSTILESVGCIWFNRNDLRDREVTARKQSFTMHLVRLMTSWAVVCDVWYLEPQYLREGETAIEFAERVRDMIAARAGLKKVPWDGYLKHNRPSPKHTEEKQRIFAESVLRRLEEKEK
ncbi:hypothetical protein EJB05_11998 [Eragrostis curvula]|uniref:Uncharacterized protein n=1 Tax=Eragrostis curvula TaxID=38414 RepID=A0A5J9VT72_9POAL|nr:hypothetical protein EJB05_11998 [Eragrostis curvula]